MMPAGSVPHYAIAGAVRRTGFRLTYSLLSLLLIIDQLLMPMFRLGSVSFKVSYFILGLWCLDWSIRSSKRVDAAQDIKRIFSAFGIILVCVLLGEFWLAASFPVSSHYEAVRGMLTFVFAALAFGLCRSSVRVKMDWLIPIFLSAIALNFLFIIFKNSLPSWLISFYYSERATSDAVGFQSVEDIIELVRPRGLFGNPNVSMLLINLIVLFIHLGLRHKLLEIQSGIIATAVVISPLVLAASFASRGEFIVAAMLAFLNYRALTRSHGLGLRRKLKSAFVLLVCAMGLVAARFGDDLETFLNVERISEIADVISKAGNEDTKISAVERPLIALKLFAGRFLRSPLLGTGISAAESEHFKEGTQYFHNDWFYILTVSGLIGTLSLVFILWQFVVRLGWPVIIPFVLPGLVNTFMLTIPAFIAYFALIGLCLAALSQKRNIETRVATC